VVTIVLLLSGQTFSASNEEEHATSADDYQFAFMGFSPVFSNYPGLSALPGSKIEIAEIGSLFHQKGLSKWLVSEQFSEKEYFKSVASRGKSSTLPRITSMMQTTRGTKVSFLGL